MKRGVILLIGGILLLALIVVFFITRRSGPTAPTQTSLTIWSPFDEGDAYQKIAEQFLAANPNVKLDFKYIQAADAKDYEAKVVDAIAGGTGPDIWLLRTDWLPQHQSKLISSKGIVNWSTDSKKSSVDAANEYFGSGIAAQNMRDGQIYTYPLAVDSLALYVNRNVVNQAISEYSQANDQASLEVLQSYPTTWAEVARWSQLLTKKSGSTIQRGGLAMGTLSNTYSPTDTYLALLQQYGGSLFSADEKSVSLHTSQVVNGATTFPGQDSLAFFSSFSNPTDPNYSWSAAMGDPAKAFVGDKVGMVVAYSSFSGDLKKLDKNFDNALVLPLPQKDDPDLSKKYTEYAAYWTHGVSRTSTHPQLAWSFLASLSRKNDQLRSYQQATGKPLFIDANQQDSITPTQVDLGDTSLFTLQVSLAKPVYMPRWQEVTQTVQDMIRQTAELKQTPQAAVDSAAESLKKLITNE